jgi:DNA-binding NarL/FixJ family response regulator
LYHGGLRTFSTLIISGQGLATGRTWQIDKFSPTLESLAMREKTVKTGVAKPIRVKIVHQNRIFRECLAAVLSENGSVIVGEIDHASPEALAVISSEDPQVVLIDRNLPEHSALELTRQIHDQTSGPGVILLTHASSQEDLADCFTAGAHGCVEEDASIEDLRNAIVEVAAGGIYCSHGLVHTMFHRVAQQARGGTDRAVNGEATLTPREIEIVRLIGDHLSNKQIAKRLSVSLYTVKNHVHNVVEKLHVSGRYEAVDYARKHRLIGPQESSSETQRAI